VVVTSYWVEIDLEQQQQ
jgi:hypothetical protein